MSASGSPPDRGRPSGRAQAKTVDPDRDVSSRTVYSTGGIAAATAAGSGLAVIVTLTIAGWLAAAHDAFGEEIIELLQGAVLAWLVGHQVSFTVPDGQIGLLPLGLVLLPGLLLYRAGRWLARSCQIERLRHVYRAALAIAGPYAAIAGTLALVARTETVEPSMPRALVTGFVIAFLASGLGVLRQLMRDKGVATGDLLELMPSRSRSLLVGMLAATGTLLLFGLVLYLVALVVAFPEAAAVTQELAPGLVGGVLLLIIQLAYLPNAVVFAVCYALGPGFAVGEATMVAPTGVSVGGLPMLPMLAALPANGPAPAVSLVALAAPFVAGVVGGVLTQRSAPDVVRESAPLWGFVCGVTTGILCAVLAESAGGPLGGGRLTEVGPAAWQIGLVAALEVGVAAAVAAWIANWWYIRKRRLAGRDMSRTSSVDERRKGTVEPDQRAPERSAAEVVPPDVPTGEGLATVTSLRPPEKGDGEEDVRTPAELRAQRRRVRNLRRVDRKAERTARREARVELRAHRREKKKQQQGSSNATRSWWRRRPVEESEEEEEEMYGITYEASAEDTDAPQGNG